MTPPLLGELLTPSGGGLPGRGVSSCAALSFILMGGVFGLCPEHTLVYINNSIGDAGPEYVASGTFDCPKCGRTIDILHGTYERRADVGGMTRLQPSPSADLLLKRKLGWAESVLASGEASEQQVAEELERTIARTAPGLKRLLDAFSSNTSMALAAWIAVLITLIQLMIAASGEISPEEVAEIVDAVLEEQATAEPAATTPEAETTPPEAPAPKVSELPTPETR